MVDKFLVRQCIPMRTALGTIIGEPMLRTTMQKSVLATCTRIKSIIPCCVAPFHRDGHVPWANVCSLLQANMSKYESSTSRTTQGWSSHMVFATYHLSLYCHLDTILPILLAEPACTARHTSAPMQPVKQHRTMHTKKRPTSCSGDCEDCLIRHATAWSPTGSTEHSPLLSLHFHVPCLRKHPCACLLGILCLMQSCAGLADCECCLDVLSADRGQLQGTDQEDGHCSQHVLSVDP